MLEPSDVAAWTGVELGAVLAGGHRSAVVEARRGAERLAVRRSRRSVASLAWELDLLVELDRRGFLVPTPVPTDGGALSSGPVSVHRWVDGREPSSDEDWHSVVEELHRLHREFADHPQRPDGSTVLDLRTARISVDADLDAVPDDVAATCLEHLERMSGAAVGLIHGDPGQDNLRITGDGRVGLIDWDESRCDVTHLDLANLGVAVLDGEERRLAENAADAWECLNAWVAEPDYARRRFDGLVRRVAPSPES